MAKDGEAGEGQQDGQEGAEGHEQEGEGQEGEGGQQKTAAELAAEKRAEEAERRAQEKEEELEKERARKAQSNATAELTSPITVLSYPDAEWKAAEERTGKTREQLVMEINQGISDRQVRGLKAKLEAQETRQAVKDELSEALEKDPISSKYRGEAKKFLADIPEDLLATPEGRKKWIGKAIEYGKRAVKLPSGGARRPETPDVRESGRGLDRGEGKDYSAEEKAVFESHGRKPEDYDKIKHPYLKDAIMIKDKPEAPSFGPKS